MFVTYLTGFNHSKAVFMQQSKHHLYKNVSCMLKNILVVKFRAYTDHKLDKSVV